MDKKRAEQAFDPVERPKHYNVHPSGVECIELAELMRFAPGNTVKYLWRAGLKDTEIAVQDLKKAAWYLQRTLTFDAERNPAVATAQRRELLAAIAPHHDDLIRDSLTHLIEAECLGVPRERLALQKCALAELKLYIERMEKRG